MKLTQQHYPTIKIDNTESDIIQIWQNGKEDSNVVMIERENVHKLVGAIQQAYVLKELEKRNRPAIHCSPKPYIPTDLTIGKK